MHLVGRKGYDGVCRLKVLDLGVMIVADIFHEWNSNPAIQAFRRRGDTEEKRRRYDWLPWEVRVDDKRPMQNFAQPVHSFDTFSLGVLILHLLVGKTETRHLLDNLSGGKTKLPDTSPLGLGSHIVLRMLGKASCRPHPSEVLAALAAAKAPLWMLPGSSRDTAQFAHTQSVPCSSQRGLTRSRSQSRTRNGCESALCHSPKSVTARSQTHSRSRSRGQSIRLQQREQRQRWQTSHSLVPLSPSPTQQSHPNTPKLDQANYIFGVSPLSQRREQANASETRSLHLQPKCASRATSMATSPFHAWAPTDQGTHSMHVVPEVWPTESPVQAVSAGQVFQPKAMVDLYIQALQLCAAESNSGQLQFPLGSPVDQQNFMPQIMNTPPMGIGGTSPRPQNTATSTSQLSSSQASCKHDWPA